MGNVIKRTFSDLLKYSGYMQTILELYYTCLDLTKILYYILLYTTYVHYLVWILYIYLSCHIFFEIILSHAACRCFQFFHNMLCSQCFYIIVNFYHMHDSIFYWITSIYPSVITSRRNWQQKILHSRSKKTISRSLEIFSIVIILIMQPQCLTLIYILFIQLVSIIYNNIIIC